MIKIIIIDDHPIVINGIKDMLSAESEIEIIGSFLNADTLLQSLESNIPDVLLLDIQLPDISGDKLALIIKKRFPQINILALTNFDNSLYVNNMLNNGALGYLLKNTEKKTLIDAIKTVSKGEIFILPEMNEKVREFRRQIQNKATSLTPRELEIIKLLAEGKSNKEVAQELFLSLRTIENYRLNLSIKLEVKNTAGLIRKTLELGLI